MGDAENTFPPTKKRAAGREISRDNPGLDDDEDTQEQETGTFKKASEEVLANRRIVKVRRPPPSSTPSTNPFANIQLIPSGEKEIEKENPEIVDGNNNTKEVTDESNGGVIEKVAKEETVNEATTKSDVEGEKSKEGVKFKVEDNKADKSDVEGEKSKEVEKAEVEDNKVVDQSAELKDEKDDKNESMEKNEGSGSFSSFKQLSSNQNAFTGIVGTGFSSSAFSFGASTDGSSASCGSGFSFNFSNNNGSSLFGVQGGSGANIETVIFPPMKEVMVETGEEKEKVVFTADSVLFEFAEGGWRERGKGEIKVNVPTMGTGKARLVMRTKGNYRLILNASLYPDMKLANMDKKGITFACINSGGEGKEGLSTFALKFKDVSFVDEFRSVVDEHKDKASDVLRTPENSPRATDE